MSSTSGKLSVEDRLDIIDLLARYARCLDARDAARFAANFAPDGALSSPRTGSIRGRAAIQAAAQGITDRWGMQVRHQTGLPLVEGDSEHCSVRSYTQVLVQTPAGQCAVSEVVEYEDTCVKIDGRWLFQERLVRRVLEDAVLQARVDGSD